MVVSEQRDGGMSRLGGVFCSRNTANESESRAFPIKKTSTLSAMNIWTGPTGPDQTRAENEGSTESLALTSDPTAGHRGTRLAGGNVLWSVLAVTGEDVKNLWLRGGADPESPSTPPPGETG